MQARLHRSCQPLQCC